MTIPSPTPSGHFLTITLRDGGQVAAAALDGGGAFVGDPDSYEIHGYFADGDFLCIRQADVAAIAYAATGEPLPPSEWGNPHFPGHPLHERGAS